MPYSSALMKSISILPVILSSSILLFTCFLNLLFILSIILWGIPFAVLGFFTISPGLEITMFLPYLAIPVSGGIMLLNLIVYIGTCLEKKERKALRN